MPAACAEAFATIQSLTFDRKQGKDSQRPQLDKAVSQLLCGGMHMGDAVTECFQRLSPEHPLRPALYDSRYISIYLYRGIDASTDFS